MPLPVRAKGVSLSTATNWAFNWIVGEVTPYLQEAIEWRLYPMHGFFCILSFILGLFYIWINDLCWFLYVFVYSLLLYVSYFFVHVHYWFVAVYPETKGVPLEEMDAVFGEGVFSVIYYDAYTHFDHVRRTARTPWKWFRNHIACSESLIWLWICTKHSTSNEQQCQLVWSFIPTLEERPIWRDWRLRWLLGFNH